MVSRESFCFVLFVLIGVIITCVCAARNDQVERNWFIVGETTIIGEYFNQVYSGGSEGAERWSDFTKATSPVSCRSGFGAGLPG